MAQIKKWRFDKNVTLCYMAANTFNERQVFLFKACFVEECKSEEVARELGISVDRLYREKYKLKKSLQQKVKEKMGRVG